MKIHNFIIAASLAISVICISCNQTKKQSTTEKTVAKPDTLKAVDTAVNTDTAPEVECTRGAAEPIFKKSVFPSSDFKLQPDKISGIETVKFDNDDKLIVNNTGCEYYCLIFRFETSRFQEDTTNLQFWYKTSASLMSEIIQGLEDTISLKQGTDALLAYIDKDKPDNFTHLKLNDEIDYGGTDIRQYVTVNKIEKIDETKFAVEISFITGPL